FFIVGFCSIVDGVISSVLLLFLATFFVAIHFWCRRRFSDFERFFRLAELRGSGRHVNYTSGHVHGGIGNGYGSKMTSNNDITSTQMAQESLARKAKHQPSTFQVVLEMCGEKYANSTTILVTNMPTIVVTPIKSKELKSATSVIKFIELKIKMRCPKKYLRIYFPDIICSFCS
ncbi:hypothetical protein RFI_04740, partial [Reticulomyxa filosa]